MRVGGWERGVGEGGVSTVCLVSVSPRGRVALGGRSGYA